MRALVLLILLLTISLTTQAQTPFDLFAPDVSRPMLQLEPETLTDTISSKTISSLQKEQIKDDIRKWLSVDPLADKYPNTSPYAYCNWNPIKFVDQDGMRPVYDLDGNLLGTDENGLQGNPIIMDSKLFTQGMEKDVAEGFDVGVEFLNKENRNSMQENYNGLSNRPDWDGQLNLSEANNWYRNGNGNPLYVDAAKVDLSPLSKSDFSAIGSSKHVNFLDPKNLNIQTGLVYGTIQVTLIDDGGTVRIGNKNGLLDIYDFDMQRGRGFRNIATQIGSMVAGKGTPFNIYYYGQGKVK